MCELFGEVFARPGKDQTLQFPYLTPQLAICETRYLNNQHRNFIEIFTRGSQTVILVVELSRFSNNILWSEIFWIIFADQNKNFVTVNKFPDPFRCSLASAFRSNHPVRITSIMIDDERQFHRFVRVKF